MDGWKERNGGSVAGRHSRVLRSSPPPRPCPWLLATTRTMAPVAATVGAPAGVPLLRWEPAPRPVSASGERGGQTKKNARTKKKKHSHSLARCLHPFTGRHTGRRARGGRASSCRQRAERWERGGRCRRGEKKESGCGGAGVHAVTRGARERAENGKEREQSACCWRTPRPSPNHGAQQRTHRLARSQALTAFSPSPPAATHLPPTQSSP